MASQPHMYVTYSLTHATAEATASHTPAPCRLSPADTRGDSLQLHNSSMIPTHAGLPASARRFSEIHTPHNLLPQQIVREEAIVYCQSINNLDC